MIKVCRAHGAAGFGLASCLWLMPCFAANSFADLMACRMHSDNAVRLACFDHETANLDRAAASTSATSPSAPVLDPKQQFGLPERSVAVQEIAAGTRAADAKSIEAHVSRLSEGGSGHIIFTLDNAQVWRQVTASDDLLLKPGDAVTISRAAFGSYWLQSAKGRGCKVSRLH